MLENYIPSAHCDYSLDVEYANWPHPAAILRPGVVDTVVEAVEDNYHRVHLSGGLSHLLFELVDV
jgi:hypothetical protein